MSSSVDVFLGGEPSGEIKSHASSDAPGPFLEVDEG